MTPILSTIVTKYCSSLDVTNTLKCTVFSICQINTFYKRMSCCWRCTIVNSTSHGLICQSLFFCYCCFCRYTDALVTIIFLLCSENMATLKKPTFSTCFSLAFAKKFHQYCLGNSMCPLLWNKMMMKVILLVHRDPYTVQQVRWIIFLHRWKTT